MFDVVEGIIHFPLKSFTGVLQTKSEFPIWECAPGTNKGSFLLVFWVDIDLIIDGKAIHRWKDLTSSTFINYLVNKGSGIVVFWTSMINIPIINTYSSLFLHDRNNIVNPIGKRNEIYETSMQKLFDFCFYGSSLLRWTGWRHCCTSLTLVYILISCSTIL